MKKILNYAYLAAGIVFAVWGMTGMILYFEEGGHTTTPTGLSVMFIGGIIAIIVSVRSLRKTKNV